MMKGKWFTLLAALFIVTAMLFALTGCGGTGETGGGGEQAAEPEASENETENTESLPADTERAVTGGAVSGMTNADGDVLIYKGIPYAAPPVGELRWRSPQPVESWDGVRACTEYSAAAVQPEQAPFLMWTEEFIIDTSKGYSEDCLYLNVWTPADAENAPVILYIHGGGNTSGGASCDVYDGEQIAKKGVVYVTINYRVGIFGFLASTELSAESADHVSGNYAIQDQIAALRWVQDNIAAFGGDPKRVTIAGQSAGSLNVNMLTVCPEAAGLFQNAVTMSYNAIDAEFSTLAEKEAEGDAIFAGRSLEEMRALSQDDVQALSGSDLASSVATYNIDGKYVIGNYRDTLLTGQGNDVNVISGMVTGDTGLFGSFLSGASMLAGGTEPATAEEYRQLAQEKLGDLAELFLTAYPAETDKDVAAVLDSSNLDHAVVLQVCNAKARAENGSAKTYLYMFTHEMPGNDPVSRGAFHTADVPYWINHFSQARADLWTDVDYNLGDLMSDYLVNFATNGDPNGALLPLWVPSGDQAAYSYMELSNPVSERTLDEAKTAFWDSWCNEFFG